MFKSIGKNITNVKIPGMGFVREVLQQEPVRGGGDEDTDKSVVDFRTATLPPGKPLPGSFEPRNYRKPPEIINALMAYVCMAFIGLGPGILMMPMVIGLAGNVNAYIIMAITSLFLLHSYYLLLRCLNDICKQLRIPRISFRYGFRIAMLHGPPWMQPVLKYIARRGLCYVAFLIIASQIGTCTVIIIFAATSLKDIMEYDSYYMTLLMLLPVCLVLEVIMRNLKYISLLSVLGTAVAIAGFSMLISNVTKSESRLKPGPQTNLYSVTFAYTVFLYNVSGIGVVLSLDKALRRPQVLTRRLIGVIDIGFAVGVVFSSVVGILVFNVFGSMDEEVLRCLVPTNSSTSTIYYLLIAGVILGYPLHCYPAIQIILEVIGNMEREKPISERVMTKINIISRLLFVLVTFILALLVPHQGPFMAVVGCFCASQLCFILPPLMDLCILYPDGYGCYYIFFWKDIIIMAVGIVSVPLGLMLMVKLYYSRLMLIELVLTNPDSPYLYTPYS